MRWSPTSSAWLEALADPSPSIFEEAVTLINICRAVDVDEFLGCAFYLLFTRRKWSEKTLAPLRKSDHLLLLRGFESVSGFYERSLIGEGELYDWIRSMTMHSVSGEPPRTQTAPTKMSLEMMGPAARHLTIHRSWANFIGDGVAVYLVFLDMSFPIPDAFDPFTSLHVASSPPNRSPSPDFTFIPIPHVPPYPRQAKPASGAAEMPFQAPSGVRNPTSHSHASGISPPSPLAPAPLIQNRNGSRKSADSSDKYSVSLGDPYSEHRFSAPRRTLF